MTDRPYFRRDLLVLAYGLIAAVFAAATFWADMPSALTLMSVRQFDLVATLAAAAHDHGPLVGLVPGKGYFPTGVGDDPGLYLLIPKLGSLLRSSSPDYLLKVLYVGASATLIGAYPPLFDRLFRSWVVTVLSPLLPGCCSSR